MSGGAGTETESDGRSSDQAERSVHLALSLGWLAKGLLFVVIGLLALEVARRGFSINDADQTGALAELASAPAGRLLVGTTSVGLLLFALWQLWTAVAGDADGPIGPLKRIGWVGLAAGYALIGETGLRIAIDGGRPPSNDDGPATPDGLTQRLFDLPGGRWATALIGVGAIAVGGYHLWKGVVGDFLDDIDTGELTDSRRRLLRILGTVGFLARSALLGVVGWLFIEAAWTYDPDKAAGIDESLQALARAPLGQLWLTVAGLGLIAAGVYDAITFRRQRIERSPD